MSILVIADVCVRKIDKVLTLKQISVFSQILSMAAELIHHPEVYSEHISWTKRQSRAELVFKKHLLKITLNRRKERMRWKKEGGDETDR